MNFTVHKGKNEMFYLKCDGKKVTMRSLPKIIPKLTKDVLNIFHECSGKINNAISGRLIEFPTREAAEAAGDRLIAKMVSDKLMD